MHLKYAKMPPIDHSRNTVTYHNALFVTPKFCISIVFSFSWTPFYLPTETEDNAYAKFWGDKHRALCYFMVFPEWSIVVHENMKRGDNTAE